MSAVEDVSMLSEQEREWLERRKNPGHINRWGYPCSNPLSYDRIADFIDAAEFEARVAENLCKIDGRCLWSHCKDNMEGCMFCRLYYARIAAEKEMDGSHK